MGSQWGCKDTQLFEDAFHGVRMTEKARLPEGSGSLNYLKRGNAYEGKMMDEVERCFIYDPEGECRGASGRKLRQVCVYCPMMQKYYKNKKRKEEQDNVEKSD